MNILLFNTFKIKLNFNLINKNKSKLNLTAGIILNKLKIKEKNMKKNIKIINYMIKLIFENINYFYKNYFYIINLVGLNYNFLKILKFFKKNIKTK